MFSNDLDDDLDGLFTGAAAPVRDLANDPLIAAQVAHVTRQVHRENCPKCRGTGRYNAPSSLGHHRCLACDGVGYREFKTAPDVRAKHRAKAAANRQAKAEAVERAANDWKAEHADAAAWLERNAAKGFEFAVSLSDSLARFGSLTAGQLAAVERCVARDQVRQQQWAAERKAREAAAPTVSIAAIETAFGNAKDNGVRHPKLRLAELIFSPAGANSKNAGAVYVKTRDDQYLGKISGGRFFRVRECSDEQERTVIEVASDPKQAAIAYGRRYGSCSVCGRELTNHTSIDAGIGPICAEKYGW